MRSKGHEVTVPEFPTPEGQNLENWLKTFEPYMKQVDEETVFVAHSLGPAFVLNILEKLSVKAKACYFVAGFFGLLGNPEFDNINESLTNKDFDWKKIKNSCEKFVCFSSNNDPCVSLEKGEELAEKLGAELEVVLGAGHFNQEAGFMEFPELLEKILE